MGGFHGLDLEKGYITVIHIPPARTKSHGHTKLQVRMDTYHRGCQAEEEAGWEKTSRSLPHVGKHTALFPSHNKYSTNISYHHFFLLSLLLIKFMLSEDIWLGIH